MEIISDKLSLLSAVHSQEDNAILVIPNGASGRLFTCVGSVRRAEKGDSRPNEDGFIIMYTMTVEVLLRYATNFVLYTSPKEYRLTPLQQAWSARCMGCGRELRLHR